ncbi:MAG: hypothetical protein ACLVME_02555 [Ezakiella coagulans]|uniref:hypothetical protein n=1 Tax=Ezakiella coagulans TaxID=46507 RepID=UPI00399C12DC
MLTTKKFIKEVEKLGLRVGESSTTISIYYENAIVARVNKWKMFFTDTLFLVFDDLSKELKEKLYNLIDKYARTPLDEREEQERFFLKFKIKTADNCNFLNYDKNDDEPTLDNSLETSNFQTQFTQKEIDDIKKRFGVTLSDFEQIPIEEVEE